MRTSLLFVKSPRFVNSIVIPTQWITFKHPPHLFAPACPSPINMTTMTRHHTFPPLVPQSKLQGSLHMPPGSTNSPTSPSHTSKTFVQVYLLHESDLQIDKPKKAPSNPQPLRHSVQRICFKCNTLFMLLPLQIKYQGQDEHDTTFKNS